MSMFKTKSRGKSKNASGTRPGGVTIAVDPSGQARVRRKVKPSSKTKAKVRVAKSVAKRTMARKQITKKQGPIKGGNIRGTLNKLKWAMPVGKLGKQRVGQASGKRTTHPIIGKQALETVAKLKGMKSNHIQNRVASKINKIVAARQAVRSAAGGYNKSASTLLKQKPQNAKMKTKGFFQKAAQMGKIANRKLGKVMGKSSQSITQAFRKGYFTHAARSKPKAIVSGIGKAFARGIGNNLKKTAKVGLHFIKGAGSGFKSFMKAEKQKKYSGWKAGAKTLRKKVFGFSSH